MDKPRSGKTLALELTGTWKGMLNNGLSEEAEYRFRKMILRLAPVTDKIYLKTLKAQELIQECGKITHDIKNLNPPTGERFFQLLTDLEKTFEVLLKNTYDFRIKAG